MTSQHAAWGGIKDFVTTVKKCLITKNRDGHGGVSKLIKNCVTSFMNDPIQILAWMFSSEYLKVKFRWGKRIISINNMRRSIWLQNDWVIFFRMGYSFLSLRDPLTRQKLNCHIIMVKMSITIKNVLPSQTRLFWNTLYWYEYEYRKRVRELSI
jgi:hypothetical protein